MIELSAHPKPNPDIAKPMVREDLEVATAIMTYAIRKNLAGFHFSGIRIPAIIQAWVPGNDLPDVESFATEVAIFQEHLHERIVALAHNQRMVREIWSLNAKTRRFRECELRKPEAARDVLDKMAALVNALFNRNEELCSTILFQCTERHFGLLVEIASAETPTKGPRTRSHVVPRHGAHIKRR
ncbi:FCD domain protein [Agrobacterium sp. DSM 25558]|uniref:FCD domain-containing protein n=1 Tax=Agrobacterium sp. DSM 25558 TaxID=1907665 RepID=UPI00097249B9|nr:FCD domain-containing protein [Agrobacterium sp. DSM 25558]SCX22776.1 FCD domain protein [Agrobacterium sp. DSM 25558]